VLPLCGPFGGFNLWCIHKSVDAILQGGMAKLTKKNYV
jgi:hypothetical protein